MITEDYCPKEIYRLLIEKGFDGEIHTIYDGEGYTQPSITHQMAMKWLREVHKIQICVEQNPYDAWHYWGFSMSYIDEKINELPNPTQAFIHICPTKLPNNCYKTYEQAVEAALKYSLENLI